MAETDKKYLKSTHDSRLEFDAQLGRYMSAYQRASLLNNLESMFDTLQGLFAMVSPYMSDKDYKNMQEALKKLVPYFLAVRNKTLRLGNKKYVKQQLITINGDLRRKASHVFLPEAGDDEATFDVAGFIRKSGQK